MTATNPAGFLLWPLHCKQPERELIEQAIDGGLAVVVVGQRYLHLAVLAMGLTYQFEAAGLMCRLAVSAWAGCARRAATRGLATKSTAATG